MKASELRIGNLVNIRFSDAKFRNDNKTSIHEIRASDILDFSANGNKSVWEYKPIPLTEEWLIRFGFENMGIDKRTFCDAYVKNGHRVTLSNSGNVYYGKLLVASVHQLQNLFYALTNEELTL